MKTNSFSRKKSQNKENIILGNLVTKNINKLARACEYTKRSNGKISPKSLILGFMLMVSKQRNTYSDWAIEIGLLENTTITKQSLNGRMTSQTEYFIMKVVEQQLHKKIQPTLTKKIKGVLKHFNTIQIEDSTTLGLPDELKEEFPGSVSMGEKKAQAKIHAMYNLTENNFSFLHIHSFCNNDQSLAAHALPYLQKRDLNIRDLGFLVLDAIEEFITKEIYFISRKNYGTKIYDIKTGAEINLVKQLRKRNFFDKEVLIGKKQQQKVRLIAISVPDAQANERKRKARTNRDKRLNHSKEFYELLDYSVYITNIRHEQCSADDIFNLYKLRWRIEIVFKSWKGCFSLEKLIHRQCTNLVRVKCMIYLMLLYIYLFHVVWWRHCQDQMEKEQSQSELSILKMASFFRQHFMELITQKSDRKLMEQIKIHCVYNNRKDRDNAKQFEFKLAA